MSKQQWTPMDMRLMPEVELKALLYALLLAYKRGGAQLVEGRQMSHAEIAKEMLEIKSILEGK
jgi:hypothetical protein